MTEDPKMAHAEDFYITEDYRAAKELYKSLLVNSPSPFIFQRLAQCHYALKEYDDAMVACEKAIELAPILPVLKLYLAKYTTSKAIWSKQKNKLGKRFCSMIR